MKEYIKYISLGILVVFIISSLVFLYRDLTSAPDDPTIAEAKRKTREQDIYWYSTVNKVAYVAILLVFLACVVVLTYSIAKSHLKKASVHTYKIGKHSEIGIPEKDLSSVAGPVAMGLTHAEQLKQQGKGLEQAFNISAKMTEMQTKQLQTLVGKRGLGSGGPVISSTVPEDQIVDSLSDLPKVPTFQELLISGDIARGNPMILGYEEGIPRRGSFLDIYSAAVAGESGSGKTSTMLFLIGSGLVACGVRFIGVDPHFPHPNSLGAKTKPLWEAGLMYMASSQQQILHALEQVERTIEYRLKQLDTDTTPVVLVIDELAFLSKTRIGSSIAHTMERISTEGRKCGVYMLASSQTWLAARTGNSSVVRDTLTSAYVHRIKPKQANLLLQDREEVDKVKKYIKQAGEVLFCPVNDDSTICRMPYTTEADMMMVAEMLQTQRVQIFSPSDSVIIPLEAQIEPPVELPPSDAQPVDRMIAAASATTFDVGAMMLEMLRERIEDSPLDDATWQKQVSQVSGVSENLLNDLVNGKRPLSLQTAKKLVGKLAASSEFRLDATVMVVAALQESLEASTLDERAWYKHVSQASGVSVGLLRDLLEGEKELSPQTAKKLIHYLFSEDA